MSVIIIRDLRAVCGAVRDQGVRPTCLAFAASDAHAALFQPFRPFSAEFVYYHAVQRMSGRDPAQGINGNAIAEALLQNGQPFESEWPYRLTLPTDLTLLIPPSDCDVFRRTMPLDGKSYDQVCELLDAGHPVVLGLRISESFYAPDTNGIIRQNMVDPETGSHAVIAVGHGRTPKQSCMLIRNSWGLAWGLEGHAFVEKSYLHNRILLTSTML